MAELAPIGLTTVQINRRQALHIIPRALTLEIWMQRGDDQACVAVLNVDQVVELAAGLSKGVTHLGRNQRVIGEKMGVFGV